MPIVEHPLSALKPYLPDNTFDEVVQYIFMYKIHFVVTKQRKTILGNYRHPVAGSNHRITVNGNLNKYEFFITFLHELAHLQTAEQYRNHVEPHGAEWKKNYGTLLQHFVNKKIFPEDIAMALRKSITNPAATANGESNLLLILRTYNTQQRVGYTSMANIVDGTIFKIDNGKLFKRITKRRKRVECVEIGTKKIYLFSPLHEVVVIP